MTYNRTQRIACEAAGRYNHRWIRTGGCKENPGVWGIGGAAILTQEECKFCGLVRERVDGDVDPSPLTNRNHGWRYVI